MDGRRRLAEPVTEGASMRPAAGAAPGSRRARSHGRIRLPRGFRRWVWVIQTCRLPCRVGPAAALGLVLGSIAYGTVRGGHLPLVVAELRDFRDSVANLA